MAGFVIDVLIEFLIRVATNAYKQAQSATWPVKTATVTGSLLDKGNSGGSQLVIVTYEYRVEGEIFTGTRKEPFLIGGLGED